MTFLPITALFVAGFSVALVLLSIPITLRRAKVGTLVGLGTDETLHRRVRAQANFIEYTPLALIAIGLVEASGAAPATVIELGAAMAVGRAFHALGMWSGTVFPRVVGMLLTYATLLGSAALLVMAAMKLA